MSCSQSLTSGALLSECKMMHSGQKFACYAAVGAAICGLSVNSLEQRLITDTASLVLAAALQAQDKKASTDIVSAMNNNGHKLAAAIFDVAGVTKIAQNPKARYTLLL